jgi:hypothetical protein
VRLLGWLAGSGIAGGMIATYLFDNSQEIHFTDFPCTILAMPIAIWGMAYLLNSPTVWLKRTSAGLIATCAVCGITMLVAQVQNLGRTPWTVSQLNGLKAALHGQAFGYIAQQDRPWWIPKYAFAAGMLDARCIRLRPILATDLGDRIAQSGDGLMPVEILPFHAGESIDKWSLKLASIMDVHYLLQTGADPVPPGVAQECDRVFADGDLILYRIKATADAMHTAAR